MNKETMSNQEIANKDELQLNLPVSYFLEGNLESKVGLLVLHGFTDSARSAKKRLLEGSDFSKLTIFSPNGFFPSPVREGDGFKEAYSWYFVDPKRTVAMIHPDFAAQAMLKWMNQLGIRNKTWIVVGFSQGGFYAPHLIKAGLNVAAVVSLGAAYRPDSYEGLAPVRLHAVHGVEDQIVPHEISLNSFKEIQKTGHGIQFYSIEKLAHTSNVEARSIIRLSIEEEIIRLGLSST